MSNEIIKKAAIKRAVALGALAASGAVSLTDLALDFAGGVAKGELSKDEGGEFYLAYAASYNKAIEGKGRNDDLIPADAESAKVSISVLKTFGLPAVANAGSDWFTRVDAARKALPADARVSVYNSYVKANRKLAGEADTAKLVTASDLRAFAESRSEDTIASWVAKPGVTTKSDADKLKDLATKVAKMREKFARGSELDAIAQLMIDIANNKPVLTLVPQSEAA